MEKNEYVRRAKDFGYTDEMIAKDIQLHEEAEKDGITVPWELDLIELPVE